MSDDCWVNVTTTFGPDVAGTLIVAALSPAAAPVPPPLPAALQYACASALTSASAQRVSAASRITGPPSRRSGA